MGWIGFSTHAPRPLILEAIASDAFDYVNLHWYFIQQHNAPAIAAARARDMGVFVISPTDKGGHLHTPSARLQELCAPLHPIVLNDLFCLRDPDLAHTISVGARHAGDLGLHLEAVALLPQADVLLPPLLERLERARRDALGEAWLAGWPRGCPSGSTPLVASTSRCCSGCTTWWRPGIWRASGGPATACWAAATTGFPVPTLMPSTVT